MKNHIEAIVFTTSDFVLPSPSSPSSCCSTHDDDDDDDADNDSNGERSSMVLGGMLVRRKLLSYENPDELARKVNELYCENEGRQEELGVVGEEDGERRVTSQCMKTCRLVKGDGVGDDGDEETEKTISTASINNSILDDGSDAGGDDGDLKTALSHNISGHDRPHHCHHQPHNNSDQTSHYRHLHTSAVAAITAATAGNPLSAYSLSQSAHRRRHDNTKNTYNNQPTGRHHHNDCRPPKDGCTASTVSSHNTHAAQPDFLQSWQLKTRSSSNPRKNQMPQIRPIPLPSVLSLDDDDDDHDDERDDNQQQNPLPSAEENGHSRSYAPLDVVSIESPIVDNSNGIGSNNSPDNNNNNDQQGRQHRKSFSLTALCEKLFCKQRLHHYHRRINSTPQPPSHDVATTSSSPVHMRRSACSSAESQVPLGCLQKRTSCGVAGDGGDDGDVSRRGMEQQHQQNCQMPDGNLNGSIWRTKAVPVASPATEVAAAATTQSSTFRAAMLISLVFHRHRRRDHRI